MAPGGWLSDWARSTSPAARSCTSTRASPPWPSSSWSASGAGWPRRRSARTLPLTILGAGVLWFGWFGFNAGGALGANGLAAQALIDTNTAAGAAVLGWCLTDYCTGARRPRSARLGGGRRPRRHHPCAGYVGPMGRWPSAWPGIVCSWPVGLKFKAGYDDALDVVGVHAVGGMLGSC